MTRVKVYLLALSLSVFCIGKAAAAPPVIQAVQNAANYQPVIASGCWIAITGANLSTSTRAWSGADFAGKNLPTRLDDVSVSINGKAAYVYFISPGQVNVLGPDDGTVGTVSVQLSNGQGASNLFSANKQIASPALFAYPQLNSRFAVIQSGTNFGLVAPPRLLGPTVTTTTVAPGNNVVLYGTGFGPVTPAQPSGQLVAAPVPTDGPVTVTIAGKSATVLYAGLISSGLYQLNITVPAVPTGDAAIVITTAGKSSSGTVSVPVQAYGDLSGQTAPALTNCLTGLVDYVTYNAALLSYEATIDVSIGGTRMCPTCNIQAPIYPQFAARLESALQRGEAVRACYDKNGQVFQLQITHR